MRKFLTKLLNWFVRVPGEDGLSEWVDDLHDEPQVVTRMFGNAIEKGEWKP